VNYGTRRVPATLEKAATLYRNAVAMLI
jgi:hypothetical protein